MREAEREEFEQFLHARWSRLFATAYLLTGNRTDAEELLQDAMVRACSAWGRIEDKGSAEAYVRRILVNQATRVWRLRKREQASEDLPEAGHLGGIGLAESRLDLWPAIRALPPRMRAVLVLRYFDDLTEEQTANALNCSVGTVKSQSHHAMKKLRESLGAGALDSLLEDA